MARQRFSIALIGVAAAAAIVAPAAALVIPPAYENADAGGGAGDLVHTVRIQTLYSASFFSNGPVVIQELRFRPSAVYGFAFTSTIANVQITLSTTPVSPVALSTSFTNNFGTNAAV